MRDLDSAFARLTRSAFRRRFRLGPRERDYLRRRGLQTVLSHARKFVAERLAPARPAKDGQQTPFGGHPVFVAQHATGTCCRSCLSKWHGIPSGRPLSEEEQSRVVAVIERWLGAQSASRAGEAAQGGLFDRERQ